MSKYKIARGMGKSTESCKMKFLKSRKQKSLGIAKTVLSILFLAFAVGYFGIRIFGYYYKDIPKFDFSKLQMLCTIFVSTLIQAFPFIFIGVTVTSIIHIFVSSKTIKRLYHKNTFTALLTAVFSGVFIPVCDCSAVPVGLGLIKEGVPVSAAVTFILAAPIVNPISIISTLYAFPNSPIIAFYRVAAGIAVAVLSGLITGKYSSGDIIKVSNTADYCVNICGCSTHEDKNHCIFLSKIREVFIHAGNEFFTTGRYVIAGAFLSSIIQVLMPNLSTYTVKNYGISLLIMLFFAFILSVCSTSDAYIARGFANQFPMSSVMGFLVFGPMIDLKNTIMLLGNCSKKFVLKLIVVVFTVSYVLLTIFKI